jgi:UDP-2,3-diacylglucosamine pyrophosphatase LpxH
MPDQRVLIISDLHLGRPRLAARSAEALRPLWNTITHLVINGDVAEVHHKSHWSQAARQTMRLFDLCEDDGVHLTLLSGNHDPYISDTRHLQLGGGRVLVTHGDVLHPAVAPWSPASGRILKAREQAIESLEPEQRTHLQSILEASQFASHAEWNQLEEEASHSSFLATVLNPKAVYMVFKYWRLYPRLAAEFAAEHMPEARFVLVGHTHRAGVWEIDGRTVINTGSFGFPGKPYAVIIEGRRLEYRRIRLRDGAYQFDAKPARIFELPKPVEHHDATPAADEPLNATA